MDSLLCPRVDLRTKIQTEVELRQFVHSAFGVSIPDVQVCENHSTPWKAFADAYFARSVVSVWKAARGFGGKSFLLALLGLTEAITLGVDVNVLGGSGEQSARVLGHMLRFWNAPNAPRYLLASEPAKRETKLTNGATIRALMASQASIRGLHVARLRFDEVDEIDLALLDAAMGQPMIQRGIAKQTVMSSTMQYADGTMAEVIKRAKEKGWAYHEWDFRASLKPHGWLDEAEVASKRIEVTDVMWCFPSDARVISAIGEPVYISDRPSSIQSGSGEIRTPSRFYERDGNEDLIALRVQGIPEEIRLTGNHVILTREGLKQARDLKPYSSAWNKITHNFGSGDMLLQPKRDLIEGGNYDFGWFIGFWLAEGSIQKDRGNRIFLAVADYEGKSVAERLSRIAKLYAYQHQTTGFQPSTTARYRSNGRGSTTVTLSHKILRDILDKWCYSLETARTKHLRELPKEREFTLGILDGWLEGDGAITKQGWVGVTYSENMAWQMFQLATDLGFSTGMTRTINQGLSRNPYWHVRVSRNLTNHRAGEIVDCGKFVARRIRSISKSHYIGKLYDMTIPIDQSYLVSGIVVHNSVEFEGQEPSPESRAIQPDRAEAMFKKELGYYRGAPGENIIIEEHDQQGIYATGADWARKQDWTIILTFRLDCNPARLVAFKRMGRTAWPTMVSEYNNRVKQYGQPAAHDGTGIGDVVSGYLTVEAEGVIMVGRTRSDMLTEYIATIERGEIEAPYIEYMAGEHRYASTDDVYGSGHLPDTIAAGALAWYAATKPIVTHEIIYDRARIG